MDHIWSKKDPETGVDVTLVVSMPEDRLPNYDECKAAIELFDKGTSTFSSMMRAYTAK